MQKNFVRKWGKRGLVLEGNARMSSTDADGIDMPKMPLNTEEREAVEKATWAFLAWRMYPIGICITAIAVLIAYFGFDRIASVKEGVAAQVDATIGRSFKELHANNEESKRELESIKTSSSLLRQFESAQVDFYDDFVPIDISGLKKGAKRTVIVPLVDQNGRHIPWEERIVRWVIPRLLTTFEPVRLPEGAKGLPTMRNRAEYVMYQPGETGGGIGDKVIHVVSINHSSVGPVSSSKKQLSFAALTLQVVVPDDIPADKLVFCYINCTIASRVPGLRVKYDFYPNEAELAKYFDTMEDGKK